MIVKCLSGQIALPNSVDPDQTAPKEQSDLGLHCLPKFYMIGVAYEKYTVPAKICTSGHTDQS